jgi:integrase
MARNISVLRLTPKIIAAAPVPSILEDGAGLKLIIKSETSRQWILRFHLHERRRHMGLGSYPRVGLEEVRATAEKIRRQVREGKDPIIVRQTERGAQTTFRTAFNAFFESRKADLSNGKHIKQWTSTMEAYVFPAIGNRPVADITPLEIIRLLKPIWAEIPDTAERVLQRVNAVFQIAIVLEHRTSANPCTGVKRVLGPLKKNVRHHPSLHYSKLPSFITTLRASNSRAITKLAFEFLILNASRSGEVRLAAASEINPDPGLWTIAEERMKARRPHIVPLSSRSLEIYREARKLTGNVELLFPSPSGGAYSDMVFVKMMKDWGMTGNITAHGFRATFKTWCSEIDKARDAVSEVALAHVDKDKVRAAYNHAIYLDERKLLMERWANFATGVTAPPTAEEQRQSQAA